jgi:hypothetical protein
MMLRGYLDIADNRGMNEINGLGVGTSVGLGAIIGLGIMAPGVATIEFVSTFMFYGFVSGVIFEAYRLAFSWKHPFRR